MIYCRQVLIAQYYNKRSMGHKAHLSHLGSPSYQSFKLKQHMYQYVHCTPCNSNYHIHWPEFNPSRKFVLLSIISQSLLYPSIFRFYSWIVLFYPGWHSCWTINLAWILNVLPPPWEYVPRSDLSGEKFCFICWIHIHCKNGCLYSISVF